jgi:hypothetical protein
MVKKVINFIGDQNFINYIKMIGFNHQHVAKTRKLYFTNGNGAQIRVDLRYKNITLLDRAGFRVKSSPGFTNMEIEKFAEHLKI